MASAISTGLHVAVLLWALVSFSGKTFEVTPAESLPVDLVSEKDFSEMTKGAKDAPKAEKPKPFIEKIDTPKAPDDPAAKLTEKKEIKATEQKVAESQPQTKPDPIAEKLKKQDDQKEQAKTDLLPPKKPEKQQPKFNADKIAALLDKRDPQRTAATGEEPSQAPTLGRANASASQLSQSEIDAFRRRVSECWSPPVGLDKAQESVVVFRVLFNPDGTVRVGPELIGGKLNPAGPIFAESAKRAILQCQPYTMLRKETYDNWKDIEVEYRLSDMYR